MSCLTRWFIDFLILSIISSHCTMAQLPPSLSNLPHHAIFVPPSSKGKEDWELVAPEYAPKTSKVVMREKDLIVAHDSEVRMAHLGEGWDVVDTSAGKYKVSVVFSRANARRWSRSSLISISKASSSTQQDDYLQ